jgi:hypothetical protein
MSFIIRVIVGPTSVCTCPAKSCEHCNSKPPFCPYLIDYPADGPPPKEATV